MITCILNGRLGNQMFQIAATIATALKYDVPYSIPRQTLNNWFPVYFQNLSYEPHSGKQYTWQEEKPEYKEIIYSGRCLKLNGYFQSYKYFQEYNQDIIRTFSNFRYPYSNVVSIHVRRGDYLTNPDFSVLGMQYYFNAIDFFVKKGYYHFSVFSDHIEWCKKNINSDLYRDCTFVYFEGNSEMFDMKVMANCEHNIIANSSFSWWGAWLNTNPNKIVIAPDTWFKGKNTDMLPPEWLIFKNQ